MHNEPLEVTLKVTTVLEELGIPYFISGSLASALYGMIRSTQDADIVTGMRQEHRQAFVSALRDEFYLDDEAIAEAIQRHSSFNLIHRETMFKVDIFIPRQDPFLQSQLARAQTDFCFGEGSQREFCQSRGCDSLQTGMVSHRWRGLRPAVA